MLSRTRSHGERLRRLQELCVVFELTLLLRQQTDCVTRLAGAGARQASFRMEGKTERKAALLGKQGPLQSFSASGSPRATCSLSLPSGGTGLAECQPRGWSSVLSWFGASSGLTWSQRVHCSVLGAQEQLGLITVAVDEVGYRVRIPGSKDTKLLPVKGHLSAVNARKSFIVLMAKPCTQSMSGPWLGCLVSLSKGNAVHSLETI